LQKACIEIDEIEVTVTAKRGLNYVTKKLRLKTLIKPTQAFFLAGRQWLKPNIGMEMGA